MATPRTLGTARPIDRAYGEINAIGAPLSAIDRDDPVALAEHRQLAQVLDILERYGAIDPDLALPDPLLTMAAAE